MYLISYASKRKKMFALLLTFALTGNLLTIVPLADSKDKVQQTTEETVQFSEDLQKKTKESYLQKASDSDITLDRQDKDEPLETVFIDEVVDLGEFETSSLVSFYSLEDGNVDLANGNHEKWIDRIVLPDYAKKYYRLLEEGTDNDGNNDWLIEDKYFSERESTTESDWIFNGIIALEVSYESEWTQEDRNYITNCIRAASAAFDRDHPEVFWIARGCNLLFTGKINKNNGYDYTIYCMSKTYGVHEGLDVRNTEYQETNAVKAAITERDLAIRKIMNEFSADDAADKILGFNEWLTMHNQYCTTYPVLGSLSGKSITALTGSIGPDGPVCEGYARALKVLCDRADIPCVLVDGITYGNEDSGHMWNYVKLDGEWYAVDVTWNDPFVSEIGAVSGYEQDYWMLLGSETPVHNGDDGKDYPFIFSHMVINNPGIRKFPNGPELSRERYPIKRLKVEFTETEQTETYTGKAPEIKNVPTVELEEDKTPVQNPKISYSYQTAENGKYTEGLPVDAGTYRIRASVASSKADGYRAANSSNTLKLTIEKAPRSIPAPAIKDTTDVSIALNPVESFTGANDGSVEYAWNTVNHLPDSGWQKEPVITGLHRNRTYYFFSRIIGGKNYQDAVSASATEGKTNKTKLPKPTLAQSIYTYTGTAITVQANHFDETIMDIRGQSAVEFGNYQAEISLTNEDFTWSDGTSAPILLDWKIMFGRTLNPPTARQDNIREHSIVLDAAGAVPEESITDGVLEYGYTEQEDIRQVKNWQSGTEFSGLESGTTYYFFVRITGGTKYIDINSDALPLTTKRIKLEKPVLSDEGNYEYHGGIIQASIREFLPERMAISDNAFRNAGNYTAKISLKDDTHYEWEDGTLAPVLINWKITKKPVTVKAADKSKYYGEENPALTLEELPEGILAGEDKTEDLKVTLSTSAEKNSAVGSYPITGTADKNSNYEVTVEPGTLTIIQDTKNNDDRHHIRRILHDDDDEDDDGPEVFLPSYVVKGTWLLSDGFWHFSDASGNAFIDNWAAAYNPYAADEQEAYGWFRFDIYGNMLTGWFVDTDGSHYYLNPVSDGTLGKMMTGWVWIADETGVQKCYYLNPNSDGWRGKMLTNISIDGYTIDEHGWWTVDGVVQVK